MKLKYFKGLYNLKGILFLIFKLDVYKLKKILNQLLNQNRNINLETLQIVICLHKTHLIY